MSQLTPEIITVFFLLALTVFLFASDIIRVDIGAIVILLLLALTSLLPGLQPLIRPEQIFSGFGSNAVIAIIAVMILSAGLDKTGTLNSVANTIIRYGGKSERKLTALICGSAGLVASFMQNTGAAALYIPITSRIASHSRIALNRLLLPMGFTAIVGGTLTTVGSSPLILMNDLLPADIEHIHLFEVTPIGLALVAAAVAYFYLFGKYILPPAEGFQMPTMVTTDYLRERYGLDADIYEFIVPPSSSLVGLTIAELESRHPLRVVAMQVDDENRVAPARDLNIEPNVYLAVLGNVETVDRLKELYKINKSSGLTVFANDLTASKAGVSEILIPPNSELVGKTIGEISLRETYGLSVLNLHRSEENYSQKLREFTLHTGDTLVCHSSWKDLARLLDSNDFLVVTTDFPHEEHRPEKTGFALSFLLLAIALVLFTDLPLSVSLLCGAMGMVLSGCLKMDEAYDAINWTTVFLLASLIPLGIAVQTSGAAAWIAQSALALLGDVPVWVLLSLIGVLASAFSLAISNVGATVLLVPLVVNIATTYNADPRLFALAAAICASNAFILPTHQVNALIMGPGDYKVKDFTRAGIGMTLIYLIVALLVINLVL